MIPGHILKAKPSKFFVIEAMDKKRKDDARILFKDFDFSTQADSSAIH